MRCSIPRARLLSVPAMLSVLPLAVSGCGKLNPNGTSDTMALLRQGSEKVCVAPDVQSTLKGMILPKAEDLADDAAPEDKLAAIGKVAVSYDLTTLQQFDKDVAKATCETTVTMSGVGDAPMKAQVSYEVSPAAENPNSFIMSASDDQAQSAAKLLVSAALAQMKTARDQQQAAAQQAQADAQQAQQDAKVKAVVSERWLKGVWVETTNKPGTCATSAAIRFGDGHVLTGGLGTGQWSISGTDLHLVGTYQGQPMDDSYTFTAADAVSASIVTAEVETSLRRCTAAETQAAPESGGSPVDVISDQVPH